MRAREPDRTGFAERDGVRLAWESFGQGDRAILFVPTWNIVHSRVSKMQVPYLARRFRVVTFDPRGNGRSDRPATGYSHRDHYLDALAVMEATGLERAAVITASSGAHTGVMLAAFDPDRVERLVLIGAALGPEASARDHSFWDVREQYEGWEKFNANYWRSDWEDFVNFFMGQAFSEPHSTKPTEDAVAWGLEADAEILIRQTREREAGGAWPLLGRVRCPVLVIHGSDDRIIPVAAARTMADELPNARLVVMEGSGHRPDVRDPVKVNLLLSEFLGAGDGFGERRVTRARHRPHPRALYISSPIGLGHIQRDLAIANELRKLRPDLEVVWMAQPPVATVLEQAGETVHPASTLLASETAHIESEAGEHSLHVFEAWRRMDEILLANFMAFHDVVRDERYDLWLGDESWELDYYLHENPELKTVPYGFMTDFVGWLPMNDSEGSHEASLAADYNQENIEQVERYPYVRDAALFIGQEPDVPPGRFGPDLPYMPRWVADHFTFPGYVLPFDPKDYADTEQLRRQLGFEPDRPLIVGAVGGSGVGIYLLRRIAAAFRLLRADVPEAQMVLVTGPRMDPGLIEPVEGMQVVGYVHDLFRTLACSDLAVVQGGLTTTMELVATRRPFIYVPLRDHFEQNHHVVHRLARYGVHPPTRYEDVTPERLAEQMRGRLATEVSYQPVESGGATRAARSIAQLLE
jgi:pimeloyl-ACP methyl ester carboxylesterase/predicted glycosyltransferase